MRSRGRVAWMGAVLAAIVWCGNCARAQDIVVGQVAGFTGPVAKDANDMSLGARIYFESVNARGGVLGRKIRLLTADDHYKPAETVKLTESMAGKVSALLPTTGSSNVQELLKDGILDRVTLPIVGTIPSPEFARTPLNKNIFHFRAGDRDQIVSIIEHVIAIGITRVGVLQLKNPFGNEGAAIAEETLRKHNLPLAVHGFFTITGPKLDFDGAIGAIGNKDPQALILFGPPTPVAELIKALKSRGETAQIYSLSYADYRLVLKTAGNTLANGVVISQVLPSLTNRALPLIKAFQRDFETYGRTTEEPTYFNLEGYISARLIVEAIRRTKDASPAGVKRGLEQLNDYDLGGYIVDFSPTRHTGSRFVDLTMIKATGGLVY